MLYVRNSLPLPLYRGGFSWDCRGMTAERMCHVPFGFRRSSVVVVHFVVWMVLFDGKDEQMTVLGDDAELELKNFRLSEGKIWRTAEGVQKFASVG